MNRREFLKLAGLVSLSLSIPQVIRNPKVHQQNSEGENIIILVFDALSACNLSLYGYERKTTPNIDRLAERATVFHNHFANGNFTTSGTASLLTGTLPWTHRATRHNDTVADEFVDKNIFNVFRHYHRMAYSHNVLTNTLLKQFQTDIDDFTPRKKLFMESDNLIDTLFRADEDIASVSWVRALKRQNGDPTYLLFLSRIYDAIKRGRAGIRGKSFPRGLPNINANNYYILEDGIDWMQEQMVSAPQPFLGYYHFLPPHYPYKTRQEFVGRFVKDDYHPVNKPSSIFRQKRSLGHLLEWRTWYDEFILYVDAEFARLYDFMDKSGLLENTWLILTTDHGEMFERDITGHLTPVMYQPIIHIPLLIFAPGQKERLDIHAKTSAIDVLPTFLHISGQEIPDWIEGNVLPPYAPSGQQNSEAVIAVQAKGTKKDEAITNATLMFVRDNYKLVYYSGYHQLEGEVEMVELFDVDNDPEELNNLAQSRKDIADELLEELKTKLEQINSSR